METSGVSRLVTVLAVIFCSVGKVFSDTVCENVIDTPAFVPDPFDCASFYICLPLKQWKIACGPPNGNKVFDPKSKTCVKRGSQFDHSACNTENNPVDKPDSDTWCMPGMYDRIEDKTNCAQYHECNNGVSEMKSCSYPNLFNSETRKCEVFLYVTCGARYEPKDPCEYAENQCHKTGCVPCRSRFGTCTGLQDGPRYWKGKPWTPHFVVCKNERVLMHGDCRRKGAIRIFHPVLRQCVSILAVVKKGDMIGVTMIDKRGRRFQMKDKLGV